MLDIKKYFEYRMDLSLSRVEKLSPVRLHGRLSTLNRKNNMKLLVLQSLFILGTASTLSAGEPFMVQIGGEEESVVFPLAEEASFADLIDSLGAQVDRSKPYTVAMNVAGPLITIKVAQNREPPRDYYTPITSQENNDLSELVRTLANNNKASLALKTSQLNRIGDRIVHLHPLKFLTIIFTNNELKVCMRNMEGKAFVWKKFQSETVESLDKENKAGNLKADMVSDFAKKVGLTTAEITPFIQNQKWEQFLSYLISKVKVEKPQGKKYDM